MELLQPPAQLLQALAQLLQALAHLLHTLAQLLQALVQPQRALAQLLEALAPLLCRRWRNFFVCRCSCCWRLRNCRRWRSCWWSGTSSREGTVIWTRTTLPMYSGCVSSSRANASSLRGIPLIGSRRSIPRRTCAEERRGRVSELRASENCARIAD